MTSLFRVSIAAEDREWIYIVEASNPRIALEKALSTSLGLIDIERVVVTPFENARYVK